MRIPDSTVFLTQAAKALAIPSLVTEQYPKAFGQTVPEIRKVLPATTKVQTILITQIQMIHLFEVPVMSIFIMNPI